MAEKLILLLFFSIPGSLASRLLTGTEGSGNNNFKSFDCQGADGRYPNPYDCSSFYECASNIPILIRCPLGQLYNGATATCDFPQNVDCSAISPRPSAEPSTIYSTVLHSTSYSPVPSSVLPFVETFSCPSPDGYFPDPELCNVFYICFQGVPDRHDCPEGLVYHPEIFACDYPSNVPPPCGTQCSFPLGNCNATEAPTTTTEPTTTTPTTRPPFTCSQSDGYFANPDDCGSYYVCYQWIENLINCSAGLVYNPNTYTCDYTSNVAPPCGTCISGGCGATTTESITTTRRTTPNTPPTGGPFTCPQPDGYFSDPESCFSFYICYQWEANIRYCAEGLVFNEAKSTCDYPYNVPPPCGTGRKKFQKA